MTALQIQRLHPDAALPSRAHDDDAGLDLLADLDGPLNLVLLPGEQRLVPTGIAIALPPSTVGMICPRSGLATKHGVTVTNAPGIVDAGYRGEVKVALINLGAEPFSVTNGMRIAQLVVTPILVPQLDVVTDLADTVRGTGGFGSTGI